MMIKDHQGRLYKVMEVSRSYTYVKCLTTGASIKIGNSLFKQMGFVR